MNSSWQQDWLNLQRQWLETLVPTSSYSSLDDIAGDSLNKWQRSLEQLFQPGFSFDSWDIEPFTPAVAETSNNWNEQLSKFVKLLPSVAGDGSEEYDWRSAFEDYIKDAKQQINSGEQFSADKFWPAMTEIPAESLLNNIHYPNKDSIQKTYQGWQEYLGHHQAYRNYLKNIDLGCLDILHKEVLLLAEKEQAITSLRELYNLWVDCYEESYEIITSSEEYSILFARVINSLLQFRSDVNKLLLGSLGKEVSSDSESSQSLDAEIKRIRQQHEADQERISLLEKKIEELAALKTTEAGEQNTSDCDNSEDDQELKGSPG